MIDQTQLADNEFTQELDRLKTTLKYLKRAPNFYEEKHLQQIRKLKELYLQLKAELLKNKNKNTKTLVKKLDKFWQELSSESKTPKEKINIIERFEIDGVDIDIIEAIKKQQANGEFPFDTLHKELGEKFTTEMEGLRIVYGKHGDCTAFLLRKILEKALFLALVKTGYKEEELRDNIGKYVGLEKLLDIAQSWKVEGVSLLPQKTIEKVKGVKFLGDVAAHNYLINVSMEDIIPQIPYFQATLKQLSKYLKS